MSLYLLENVFHFKLCEHIYEVFISVCSDKFQFCILLLTSVAKRLILCTLHCSLGVDLKRLLLNDKNSHNLCGTVIN